MLRPKTLIALLFVIFMILISTNELLSTPIPIDWNNGNTQTITLGGNAEFSFSNGKSGATYKLIIKQDGTGNRTVTWLPTNIKWYDGIPTLSTTSGAIDVVTFIYNGTDYLGNFYKGFHSDSAGVYGGSGWIDDGTTVRLSTSTDNVGIGTTSPSSLLHLEGTASTIAPGTPFFTLKNTHGTSQDQFGIQFINTGYNGSARINSLLDAGGSTAKLQFLTGGVTPTVAMTIDGSGNVGIGTTTPGQKLDVNGILQVSNGNTLGDPTASLGDGARISLNASGTNPYAIGMGAIDGTKYPMWFQTGDANGGGFEWYIGTSEKMRIDKIGNVGVGTTTPRAKLDVRGDANEPATGVGDGFSAYIFGYAQPGLLVHSAGYSTNNDDIARFSSIGSGYIEVPRMVIKGKGNVGINTTSPYARLDLNQVSPISDWDNPANANILITSSYTGASGTYDPGIYWRTTNNIPTEAKAGIFVQNSSTGSIVYIYNSNSYGAGMTGGAYLTPGASAWSFSSDLRLKTNIKNISSGLDIITKLNPVSFNWKNEMDKSHKTRYGLIAQDVLKVIPDIVDNSARSTENDTSYYGISYGSLIPFLISAIKEQQNKIGTLENIIEVQQQQIDEVKALIKKE